MNLHLLKSKLLTIFGDIKIYKYPLWLVYCPNLFQITGIQTRETINIIQDGDLILRGFNNYLDGFFIPGKYSHTGIYIGDGQIIHATAEGVNQIDIIDFLRCDRFIILRPNRLQETAIQRAKEFLERKTPYDFDFKPWNNAMYCHEFGAQCYYGLNIKKKTPIFLGFIKAQNAFLTESFLESPDFQTVIEHFKKRF